METDITFALTTEKENQVVNLYFNSEPLSLSDAKAELTSIVSSATDVVTLRDSISNIISKTKQTDASHRSMSYAEFVEFEFSEEILKSLKKIQITLDVSTPCKGYTVVLHDTISLTHKTYTNAETETVDEFLGFLISTGEKFNVSDNYNNTYSVSTTVAQGSDMDILHQIRGSTLTELTTITSLDNFLSQYPGLHSKLSSFNWANTDKVISW